MRFTVREKIALIDRLEQAFESCSHPYASTQGTEESWCNVCGAFRIGSGPWLKPHWRDVLVRSLTRHEDGGG